MEFVECVLLRNGCLTCLDGHGGHPVGLHVCYQVVQAPHSSDRWVVQPMGANHPVAVRMEHMRMGRRLSESAQWGALAMQTLWLTVQTKTVGLRREHQAIFKRSIEKCNSIFNIQCCCASPWGIVQYDRFSGNFNEFWSPLQWRSQMRRNKASQGNFDFLKLYSS